jgi:hypothetical protein
MKIGASLVLVAGLVTAALAAGQIPAGASVEVISPVFHQLVAYSLPSGFQFNAPEHANAKSYLREVPLKGQTVEHWTQMITLTGENGATATGLTVEQMMNILASGYKSSCPQTFAYEPAGATTISGQKAFVALVSCGRVTDAGGAPDAVHSESAMILAIAGSQDMYTLQWAERAAPSDNPLPPDVAKWKERLHLLEPIHVCAEVPGEKAPYPSCLGK